MDYVISASYGNDSMAMIRWAYEQGLKNVVVAYCDTGWSTPGWDLKVGADKTGETTLGLLRRLEQEMRYAGWGEKQKDNYERAELYAEVCEFLGDK